MPSRLLSLQQACLPWCVAAVLCFPAALHAAGQKKQRVDDPPSQAKTRAEEHVPPDLRLIEIYKMIGTGHNRQALSAAHLLTLQYPHFQLGHLVYGDLLNAQRRPLAALGDVDGILSEQAKSNLQDLREESRLRMQAIRERPPEGRIPAAFLQLSERNKHAIAVDASRSRLYLFENRRGQPILVADYYISLGKLGIEKSVEGDLRTPLGIYFVMGSLPKKSLKPFYGAGALPINYPNPYDNLRGKTGSGIWLHGTPPEQYARAPRASDGCVVLANPDLRQILHAVEARTTPVVIAPQLHWVEARTKDHERQSFLAVLAGWKRARTSGQMNQVLPYYTSDFRNFEKNLDEWRVEQTTEIQALKGKVLEMKHISTLNWKEPNGLETMVVTFDEIAGEAKRGVTKRQYWIKLQGGWKIFFEGVIG